MYGIEALERLLTYSWDTCLDIGTGRSEAAAYMKDNGRNVVTLDINPDYKPDLVSDYLNFSMPNPGHDLYDAIWVCHVLEHQPNVLNFLRKCYLDLEVGGFLAITVPPAKHEIVGGHLTIWNEGLLLYNLIRAGFDCADARVGIYDYNISVIVRKVINTQLAGTIKILNHDAGDILKLRLFFPKSKFMHEGKDGRLGNIRW